jgi:hypothetical protein
MTANKNTGLICNGKAAAIGVLETFTQVLPRGTQKDAILAVINWIKETASEGFTTPEAEARLKEIFEGSEWEKKGQAWLDREMEDPRYPEKSGAIASDGHHHSHDAISEPEDGAELNCFWSAEKKAWEPSYSWPVFSQKTTTPIGDLDEE